MGEQKVSCPLCSQDWVYKVHLDRLERDAFYCPECSALWLEAADVGTERWHDYNAFMRSHGSEDPGDMREMDILEPLVR